MKKSLEAIHEAFVNGADQVLFPEVQLTKFFPQYRNKDVSEYAITISSDIVTEFKNAVSKTNYLLSPILIMTMYIFSKFMQALQEALILPKLMYQ